MNDNTTDQRPLPGRASASSRAEDNEPAGDEGFCFDLRRSPLSLDGPEPWLATRAPLFIAGEWPLRDRRQPAPAPKRDRVQRARE